MNKLTPEQQQQIDQSIETLRNQVDINPSNWQAWMSLGELVAVRSPFATATETLTKVIESNPRESRGWLLMAQVILRQHGGDTALTWLADAISVNQHLAGPDLAKGWVLTATDQIDAAIDCYQNVTEKFPNEWQGFSDLGVILLRRGELESAVYYLEKASKLYAGSAELWLYLSSAYLMSGSLDNAVAAANETIRLDSENAPAYANRAEARELLGKREAALEDYRKALQLKPDAEIIRTKLEALEQSA